MPWVESHTVLSRHRKLRELALSLRLRPAYVAGHLHFLWHAALEQQEDGDLSLWTDEFIADQADFPGDAPQFVRLLQDHKWLDGRLIHDWLDYAGRYLETKYRTSNPTMLEHIWMKHGRVYEPEKKKVKPKPDESQTKVRPPDQPEITNPPYPPTKAAGVREVLKSLEIGAAEECSSIPGITPAGVLLEYLEALKLEKAKKIKDARGWLVDHLRNGYRPKSLLTPKQVYDLCKSGRVLTVCGHVPDGKIRHGVARLEITSGAVAVILESSELLATSIEVKCDRSR